MDNIPYSRIHVIYVLRMCAVGFALHNVRDIFLRKWPLVMFNISVACHNFKTTVRNYSVTRRMPSIAIFAIEGLFCRNDYVINPSTQYSWFTGR